MRVALVAALAALTIALPAGAGGPATTVDAAATARDATIDRALLLDPAARAGQEATRLVEAGWSVVGPVSVPLDGQDGQAEEAESAPTPEEPSGFAYAEGGGDLDGDGLDDALAWTDGPQGVSWVGISGLDGEVLWRSEGVPVGYVIPLELDLTGDGIDDLLERTHDGVRTYGPCPDCPDSTSYHYEGLVTLALRSGADGSVVWRRTDRDHHLEVDGESDGTTTRAWTTTVNTRLLGFADGRVVLAHVDHHVEEVEERQGASLGVSAVNGERTVEGSTTIEWLEPTGGTTTASGTLPRSLAGVYGEGLADFTGDGSSDVLVSGWTDPADTWTCVEVPGGRVCPEPRAVAADEEMHLVDGASATSIWTFSHEHWSPTVDVLGDVDGDAAADFALQDWSAAPPVLRVFSGRTQEELWSYEDASLRSHGRADGQALLIIEEYASDAEVFVRLDAATGEEVLRTRHERPEDANWASSTWVGSADVNGDGMPEVWLDITYRADDGDSLVVVDGHHFVEDGATGLRLFDLPPGGDEDSVWTSAIDDLDGDGGDDVRVRHREADTVRFHRGADFSPLWTADAAWPVAAGDMDGRPGQELVTADGCAVTSVAGATGAVRWSVDLCG